MLGGSNGRVNENVPLSFIYRACGVFVSMVPGKFKGSWLRDHPVYGTVWSPRTKELGLIGCHPQGCHGFALHSATALGVTTLTFVDEYNCG